MSDLAAISGTSALVTILLFSLVPDIALNLLVLLYPKDHPHRRELIAELKIAKRWERPFFVAEQVCMIIREAMPLRAHALAESGRQRTKRRWRKGDDEPHKTENTGVAEDATVGRIGAIHIMNGDGQVVSVMLPSQMNLDVLSPIAREVILCRIVRGQSTEKVARALNISAARVRLEQFRAVLQLREQIMPWETRDGRDDPDSE